MDDEDQDGSSGGTNIAAALAGLSSQYTTPEAQAIAKKTFNELYNERGQFNSEEQDQLHQLDATAQSARDALKAAREKVLSQRYNEQAKWFALAGALGQGSKSGRFGEELGRVGNVLSEHSVAKRKFQDTQDADALKLQLESGTIDQNLVASKLAAIKARRDADKGLMTESLRVMGREIRPGGQGAGSKNMSPFGKIAADEGLQPNTPQFTARVKQLYNIDLKQKQQASGVDVEQEDPNDRNILASTYGVPISAVDPFRGLSTKARQAATQRSMEAGDRALAALNDSDNIAQGAIRQVDRFMALNEKQASGPIYGLPGISWLTGMSAAAQEMDQIRADIARKQRQPGEGQVSNFDATQFLVASPGRGKNFEVNKNIALGIKTAKQLQIEQHDFLRNYLAVNRHLTGAKDAWNKYLEANPIFDPKAKQGSFQLNKNRNDYQTWFRSQQAPPIPAAEADAADAETGGGAATNQVDDELANMTPEQRKWATTPAQARGGQVKFAKGGKVSGLNDVIRSWLDKLNRIPHLNRDELDEFDAQQDHLMANGVDVHKLVSTTPATPADTKHAKGGKVAALSGAVDLLKKQVEMAMEKARTAYSAAPTPVMPAAPANSALQNIGTSKEALLRSLAGNPKVEPVDASRMQSVNTVLDTVLANASRNTDANAGLRAEALWRQLQDMASKYKTGYGEGGKVSNMLRAIHTITGKIINPGDTIKNFRGEDHVVESITPDPRPGKSGRINTNKGSFYPGVFNAEIKPPEVKVVKARGGAVGYGDGGKVSGLRTMLAHLFSKGYSRNAVEKTRQEMEHYTKYVDPSENPDALAQKWLDNGADESQLLDLFEANNIDRTMKGSTNAIPLKGMAEGGRVDAEERGTRALIAQLAREAAQGATYNFSDELLSGGDDAKLKDERAALEEFGGDNPVSAIALQGAGAVPTGMGAGAAGHAIMRGLKGRKGKAAAIASLLERVLPKSAIGKMAVSGALNGAVAGAGASQGDPGADALTQGAVGGILGPLGGLASKYGLGASRRGVDLLRGTAPRAADEKVLAALAKDVVNPDDVVKRLAKDTRAGVPATIGDSAGKNTSALVEAVAGKPGRGPAELADKLEQRQATQGARVEQQVNKALKPSEYFSELDKLKDELYTNAKPMYEAAYKNATPIPVRDVSFLYDSKEGKTALKAAINLMNTRGIPIGKKDVLGNVKRLGLQPLDYTKQALDDMISKEESAGSTSRGSALRFMRNKLRDVLDNASPDYKAARGQYAGDLEVLDALKSGREEFSKMTPKQVENLVGNMSFAEKDAYRTGVAQTLFEAIGKTPRGSNVAAKVVGTPALTDKLAPLFDKPKQAADFNSALMREFQLHKGSAGAINNATRQRAGAASAGLDDTPLANAADFALDAGQQAVFLPGIGQNTGGPWSTARLMQWVRNKLPMSEQTANEAADMLGEGDPKKAKAIIERLKAEGERLRKRGAVSDAVARAGARATAVATAPDPWAQMDDANAAPAEQP